MKKFRWYRAKLYNGNTTIAFHYFKIPYLNERGGYTQTSSYNWFNDREANRHYKLTQQKKPLGRWCYIERFIEAHRFESMVKKRLKELGVSYQEDKLPFFKHQSLWDFYKAVGYDYKKKKWM
jgi:hypothetical protein